MGMTTFKMRAVIAVLLNILLSVQGSSTIKNLCIKGTDSDCDSGWTPVVNMAAALVGYDLPTGNPFSDEAIEDPGLRKQIFNATMPFEDSSGSGFKVEAGITARKYQMCDDKFTTQLATNVKNYKKVAMKSSTTGHGFDVGIEADMNSEGSNFEGSLPSLVNIAWDVSNDAKAASQFFSRTHGAIAISEAQCITHKVEISPFLTPHFHPSFVEVLGILEKQETEVKQIRAFKSFIRDYGTHFLSSAFLGAKISAVTYFTAFEKLKNGARAISDCASQQAVNKFDLETEANKTIKCWNVENNDIELNGLQRTKLTTFGSKPTSNKLQEWKDQEIQPIPIKFEMTPIVNLLTVDNLDERYNISSKAILEWFLPLYLKYCKVLKYGCTVPTGCGIDDECRFEETCIIDRSSSKGHRCQATSWADVPNWPQIVGGGSPVLLANLSEERTEPAVSESSEANPNRRSDTEQQIQGVPVHDPEPANISWFRSHDYDSSGTLNLDELLITHQERNWFNQRYRFLMERLLVEADINGDRQIDMNEFIRLHEKHPWYPEQLSFLLVNTDNNAYLSKDELLEASKASGDMVALQFNHRQLENLVDGVLAIGDKNQDKRISFEEYVHMATDTFVENFAPNNLKRIFMH